MPVREGSAMGSEDSQATAPGWSGPGRGRAGMLPQAMRVTMGRGDEGMVTAMSGRMSGQAIRN